MLAEGPHGGSMSSHGEGLGPGQAGSNHFTPQYMEIYNRTPAAAMGNFIRDYLENAWGPLGVTPQETLEHVNLPAMNPKASFEDRSRYAALKAQDLMNKTSIPAGFRPGLSGLAGVVPAALSGAFYQGQQGFNTSTNFPNFADFVGNLKGLLGHWGGNTGQVPGMDLNFKGHEQPQIPGIPMSSNVSPLNPSVPMNMDVEEMNWIEMPLPNPDFQSVPTGPNSYGYGGGKNS